MPGAGGSFQTELPTMQTASAHVTEVNQAVQAQLSSFIARLEPLASTWQGGAAAQFQVTKQRWHDDASRLNQALARIAELLAQSQQTYATTEDANQQSFSGLAGQLGG